MPAPWKPTDEEMRLAETMATYGIRHEDIAKVLGVNHKTLVAHCGELLENAHTIANQKVAETAYNMAVSGKHPAMTMFWLKTRLGWRETQHINLSYSRDAIRDEIHREAERLGWTPDEEQRAVEYAEALIRDRAREAGYSGAEADQ